MVAGSLLGVFVGVAANPTFAAPNVTCVTGTPCTTSIGVTVGAGSLSAATNAPIVNNGTAIAITGQDQTVPFRFLTTVTDARGSGAGWRITASATPLTFGTGGPSSALILDSTTPVTVSCATNSSCSTPSGLTLASGGTDMTGGVTLVSAPAASGLGGYNITALGNFTLPGNAGSGTPTGGAISVTVAAAP